ncbi:hypothetical protein baBA2_000843 [Borrelia anserina]|uniref:Uncharacterized protein n=2 Tax=Borrelia anserina TaxID=143 RepID=W5SPI3_BORAN|nr:hypothetical protein [Borrelia anserina]AHH08815.1 Hypothetical protein BAN_0031000 [Borrelia anserina BA2]APR65255.1 hypothetical protein N187_04195 [Borrelia anserina Es]UPA07183.1 hypothetical protein baBA2_000843 [Borrelia anserina]
MQYLTYIFNLISLYLICSCALFNENSQKSHSSNTIFLTHHYPPNHTLVTNITYTTYHIPLHLINTILEHTGSPNELKMLAINLKISPQKIEEIKNYLLAYQRHLNNSQEWKKFLEQSNVNGYLIIKVNTSFRKKSDEISSGSINKSFTELTETQMYLEKEILALLEQVFYEKNMGYIPIENIKSFFPQDSITNYAIHKDIINGIEYISPHIIANQLLKIKDKQYFNKFMIHLQIENNKITEILQKQKTSDEYNNSYYSTNLKQKLNSINNHRLIPNIIDPETKNEITPQKLRSILSNGDILLIKPKIDWTDFFYFWQHTGVFDADKYDNTKKIAFKGKDSFEIKSVITSNQIKFDTASVQGSGYEKLTTYVQSRILKIFSPITDKRTIQKAINFARNRYVDNNFGYMVPLLSSNMWTDAINLEEIYHKTYCSLVVDRIYKIAGLNVSRNYEISGIVTPGEINAAAYDFYMSYTIAGILPSMLPKRLIKPTLIEKFIGYNREVKNSIENQSSNEKIFGRPCNITNAWCLGS